jgi:hypothetical protein
MEENRNAAPAIVDESGTSPENKDTNNNRIKWLLRKVLREGGRYTAKELNALTGQNDSRKRMSQLRREGMNIQSMWIDNPRCKLYWLQPDEQPTLFGGQEDE